MEQTKKQILGLAFLATSFTFSELMIQEGTANASSLLDRQPTSVQAETRLEHAQELLGKRYKKSPVKGTEKAANLHFYIHQTITKRLRPEYKKRAWKLAEAIISESNEKGFDPLFLMAVIRNESNFDVKAKGSFGEIGLMQLKPDTAEWIARKYGIAWSGTNDLYDPAKNVRLGVAYMAFLREKFAKASTLYISAYNMGEFNVRRIVARNVKPKIYATKVMGFYLDFYADLARNLREAEIVVEGLNSNRRLAGL